MVAARQGGEHSRAAAATAKALKTTRPLTGTSKGAAAGQDMLLVAAAAAAATARAMWRWGK
jgi:hypothetical protein